MEGGKWLHSLHTLLPLKYIPTNPGSRGQKEYTEYCKDIGGIGEGCFHHVIYGIAKCVVCFHGISGEVHREV